MFRNPRENASSQVEVPVKPSIGRAPTPPHGSPGQISPAIPTTTGRISSTKPLTPQPTSKTNVPTLGRQGTKKVAGNKTPSKAAGKIASKGNSSILNFFKKADPVFDNGALFIAQDHDAPMVSRTCSITRVSSVSSDDETEGNYDSVDPSIDNRYNEVGGSCKKRKVSNDVTTLSPSAGEASQKVGWPESHAPIDTEPLPQTCTPPPPEPIHAQKQHPRKIGAFVDESDSESDDDLKRESSAIASVTDPAIQHAASKAGEQEIQTTLENQSSELQNVVSTYEIKQEDVSENMPVVPELQEVINLRDDGNVAFATDADNEDGARLSREHDIVLGLKKERRPASPAGSIPSLKMEATSYSDLAGFDDIEEFPDDEYVDGEEFSERRWMEEQALLEDGAEEFGRDGRELDETALTTTENEEMSEACPICSAKLGGITAQQVSEHVNACLDGNPIPLPPQVKSEFTEAKFLPPGAGARFSRAAIARPGQANPFELGQADGTGSSAFSKLMSGKAEDAAWANAAAAEHASRGKPAYQRTCPFYKIMPGFFICVDAFRYGAVQGCHAYFLSHFHSDHYVGLTSTWCHGPIYCSKVTANLVRQQLRVEAKWVVPLEFDNQVEVPGTQGVHVTMIPANHCPGSSLYLFEKVIGKGSSPKVQRVLHCGDFRACPAHIAHPLLMPEIVDSITGKTRQQKIDVCYLDTTYLNPRYAFPSQEDVIRACADMCVSLKKERAEESDGWEMIKKERAGAGMVKFVNGGTMKSEDDSIAMTTTVSDKPRGRLLVICGTYSIGKERICMGIARALDCKIWAAPGKMRICKALEDPELMSRMTDDPTEAQIHMQMLMEIRAETLQDYLNSYKPHFSRIVGFRPSGWNYRPPNSRFVESPAVSTVLHSDNWKSRYSMAELLPQRGSTREASCFGVPYSEHSSFRELTMFCCALRIEKIVPTVNVGSAPGRAKMKAWIERWLAERRKNGVVKIGKEEGEVRW